MDKKNITGVFFYFSDSNHKLKLTEIIEYIKNIPEVVVIPFTGGEVYSADVISKEITDKNLQRIIIAGDIPGMVKGLFTKSFVTAGRKADNVLLVSFKEHGIFENSHKDRAIAALLGAIYDIPYEKLIETELDSVNPDTLVIGGGIAGIQASLEIADANKKVILVEKTGTIGGHMAMFDKTFPTLDCAACILTPKMVEIGQHSNIDLKTYAEVKEISGVPGNYKVKILQKARKVNIDTCIGCGLCSAKCPAKTQSEFDAGTTLRKAIYIPFPQAVPNQYLIDAEICSYVQEPYLLTGASMKTLRKKEKLPEEILKNIEKLKNTKITNEDDYIAKLKGAIGDDNTEKYKDIIYKHTGKCKNCIRFCPVLDCIDLDEKDSEIEVTVGNIIVATGFETFDAEKVKQYGYGKLPNVLTSLELERLINAAGPTEGKITMRTEDKKGNKIFTKKGEVPKSVALIHCVGSRDVNHNEYCSKVCCMYSLKLAHLVKEKLPDAEVSEYFIDMRAFGKGYEEFYERIKEENVNIIRGKTAKIEQLNGQLKIRGENIIDDRLIEDNVDMVVLSVGLEPRKDASQICKMLGLTQTDSGWFDETNYNNDPTGTLLGGISIAGVCQGPKDIPDTVAQASAAAAKVLKNIISNKTADNTHAVNIQDIEKNLEKFKK